MKFYLDSDKTDKVEINPLNLNGILNIEEDKEYTIYWEWPYDSGNDNIHDIDYQGKTFTIDVSITGKQTR
ncbi:unknown [Firmicutes bacterium CAG:884]|nr:unknown [Firmicutes bacterium CAG:884]